MTDATTCDLLIRNALLFDGSGAAARTGDLAVTGDRIAALGDLQNWHARGSIEEAIRRMTSLPAERFGLTGRGRLKQNYAADLVLFDPATIKDRATFEAPTRPSDGIVAVWVNGRAAWRDGRATSTRAGRALRRQQMQSAII